MHRAHRHIVRLSGNQVARLTTHGQSAYFDGKLTTVYLQATGEQDARDKLERYGLLGKLVAIKAFGE